MKQRYEYDCVMATGDSYQNILTDKAKDGWQLIETLSNEDIFVFERPYGPK